MIKVGFIGVGGMGMGQARSFAKVKGCQVVAASDIAEPSRANFAKAFPEGKVFSDHRELLASGLVDAVVVSTPTFLHLQTVSDSLKAGLPVLTEKPLGRTVADCHKMIEVSAKTRKLLMVAHCRRFDTNWGTFARIYRSGALGAPVLWRHVSAGKFSNWCPSTWFLDDKLGGGPLIDGAVHNYDFANYLFGEPESVVSSSIKLDKSCTAVDTGSAVVRYKNGNQLMLSWSWAVSGMGMIDVIGARGAMQFGPGDQPTDKLDTKNFGYFRLADVTGKKVKLVKFKVTDMYVTQAKHFLDCVAGKAKCQSPATEAIKAVAVAEAILKAGPAGKEMKVKW